MTSPVSDAKEELASTAGPRNMPWQALSALASEYGNAVREKFTQDPRISASGCVEQSRRVHASVLDQSGESPASSQPQDADRDLKFAEAVQADIQRVDRKIIAADASKQVILRFNFMSGAEARVRMLSHSLAVVCSCPIVDVMNRLPTADCDALHRCLHSGRGWGVDNRIY